MSTQITKPQKYQSEILSVEFDTVEGVLRWLERTFPEPIVSPGADKEKLMYTAGQASVAKALRQMVMRSRDAAHY